MISFLADLFEGKGHKAMKTLANEAKSGSVMIKSTHGV